MQNITYWVNDCLEANRYYSIMSYRNLYNAKAIQTLNDVISDAYLMRVTTLTQK